MTTVAWDGEIVAADTLLNSGGHVVPGERVQKVLELPDGTLFCGSGTWEEVMLAFDWLAGGRKDPRPRLESFGGMLVTTSGVEFVAEGLRPYALPNRYYAIGSGSPYALTAMELGKTAKQAVGIAMRFDRNTGGQIQTFVPNKVKKPRRRAACQDHKPRTNSKTRSAHSRKSSRSARSSKQSRCFATN